MAAVLVEDKVGYVDESGEMAIVFSPSQSIRFSGGYVFRSGSLHRLNEDEAEQIIRLSASLLY